MTGRWIILRTGGGKTLALAKSLADAGFDVWTPARTLRRSIRAKTPSGQRIIETDAPVLPTFVFARERHLEELAIVATQAITPHPEFSVFRHAGRTPLVGDGEVQGLRDEEARYAATLREIHAAETYAEAEEIRIKAIKSESARRRAAHELERGHRRALRSKPAIVATGMAVEVLQAPAFVGVTGVVEAIEGAYARVRFGTSSWKIEGWRVIPATVDNIQAPRGIAA